jgi:hypothetical protein
LDFWRLVLVSVGGSASAGGVVSDRSCRRCAALLGSAEAVSANVQRAACSSGDRQLELVQALAVVSQGDQIPLPGHLAVAAQGEAGEAEDGLDDAEDRLDRLLAQLV